MTNPNDAVGTNAAYGTRTSVNAFNDFAQLVNGRGILSGWAVSPKSGMVLNVGGIAGTRDVAIAEDNLGNRTTVDNRSGSPIEVELEAASASSNRYDAIVVYVNNPAQADDDTPDAPSVCGIIAVQGGTTGVSEQQIRAAISADGGTGSVAYYAVLATIFIGAGTSAITSANITQEHIAISASDIADGEITNSMIDWGGMVAPSADYTLLSSTYGIRYVRRGAFCLVNISFGGAQVTPGLTLATMPAGYRPAYGIVERNGFDNQQGEFTLNSDGTIKYESNNGNSNYGRASFFYPVASLT